MRMNKDRASPLLLAPTTIPSTYLLPTNLPTTNHQPPTNTLFPSYRPAKFVHNTDYAQRPTHNIKAQTSRRLVLLQLHL